MDPPDFVGMGPPDFGVMDPPDFVPMGPPAGAAFRPRLCKNKIAPRCKSILRNWHNEFSQLRTTLGFVGPFGRFGKSARRFYTASTLSGVLLRIARLQERNGDDSTDWSVFQGNFGPGAPRSWFLRRLRRPVFRHYPPKAGFGPLTPQSSTVVAHHERKSW